MKADARINESLVAAALFKQLTASEIPLCPENGHCPASIALTAKQLAAQAPATHNSVITGIADASTIQFAFTGT
jgi:hypothetical protein